MTSGWDARLMLFLGLLAGACACGEAPPPPAPESTTTTATTATTTVVAQEEDQGPTLAEIGYGVTNGPDITTDKAAAARSELPEAQRFWVYSDDGAEENHFVPSGWMGDAAAITVDAAFTSHVNRGSTCQLWNYAVERGEQGWAGVYWQNPEGNWNGTVKGAGADLRGARRLVFSARGETGNEVVTFGYGGLKGRYGDSTKGVKQTYHLTREWTEYVIPLSGNLSHIIGGFYWTVDSKENSGKSITFYLDDIRYEY